jgi:YidC/Oxa1 family membrane protein insertase
MTKKKTPKALESLRAEFDGEPRFTFDTNIAAQESLHRSDVMVSDWSGAALEYAFGLERPVVYVDDARKVNNPDYEALGIEPFEASVREHNGRVVGLDELHQAPAAASELLREPDAFAGSIRRIREENIFNVGKSGPVAADVIEAKVDAYLRKNGLAR